MVAAQGIATNLSYLSRMMNRDGDGGGKSAAAPITRNLLGGCCELESKELDLDLQVPNGWEKRLDLKTGKIYLQRCNSPNSLNTSTSSSDKKKKPMRGESSELQDLNFPPATKQQPLTLFDESCLDLKLFSSTTTAAATPNYQSVCTLDKVRSALERAEKETSTKKRSNSMSKSASPPSNSSNSSSIKGGDTDYEEKSYSSFAAGCPNCLLYVLITKENPMCPRCNTAVPSPGAMKKPRIDLNIAI